MIDFRNQDVVDDYYMFRKDRYESESIAANQLRGKVGNGSYTAAEVRGEKTQANNAKKERIENKNSEIRYHKVAAGETLYSIAKRRKELGLKQYEVCELVDVNYKYLSNIETGRSAPSLELIMSLSRVLKTTPDYFLLGTVASELSDNGIASMITPMTDEHKKLIRGMVELITEIENG